jgi:hypothetical protein
MVHLICEYCNSGYVKTCESCESSYCDNHNTFIINHFETGEILCDFCYINRLIDSHCHCEDCKDELDTFDLDFKVCKECGKCYCHDCDIDCC